MKDATGKPIKLRVRRAGDEQQIFASKIVSAYSDGQVATIVLGNIAAGIEREGELPSNFTVDTVATLRLTPQAAASLVTMLTNLIQANQLASASNETAQ